MSSKGRAKSETQGKRTHSKRGRRTAPLLPRPHLAMGEGRRIPLSPIERSRHLVANARPNLRRRVFVSAKHAASEIRRAELRFPAIGVVARASGVVGGVKPDL